MHFALWAVQVILGIKLISVSYTHGLRPSQPGMQESMQRMGRLARPLHTGVAILAFAGALGLILPSASTSTLWLIPVTAVCLSVLLLSSMFFHLKSREKPNVFVSLILFAFAVFVAYGRWGFLF